MEELIIKMSHITTIQLLQSKVGGPLLTFDYLDSQTVEELEGIRDTLVVSYNKALEARKFAADMIYNRR